MSIAFLTDTHVGCRSSSSIFREYMRYWYDSHFFPDLKAKNIKHIIHGGDFFDNRNSVSLQDIDFVVNWFAKRLIEDDLHMTVVLGNHDVAFKNTNKIHSLTMLKAAAPNNVDVVEDPKMVELDGQWYALVPWINSSNYDESVEFLNNIVSKPSVIVVGHFEIIGAKMYANSPVCEHGLEASLFKQFKEVWSGHFHHKSDLNNIKYLGSAFHLNWQDYGDKRGYHIYDSSSDTLEFVENEYSLFLQVMFDGDVFKQMSDEEFKESFESRFVRIVVDCEYDNVALLDTISKINRCKPHDLQVINHQVLSESNVQDNESIEQKTAKSTIEYINSYIENESDSVKELMVSLYNDAHDKLLKGE